MEMVDSVFNLSMLWSVLGALVSLAVLGVCVYYVITKPGTDSVLMVIGSFVSFIMTLFYSVGITILTRMNGMDFYENRWLFSILGFVGLLGHICFAAGLIVLIVNHVKTSRAFKSYNGM